MTRETHLRSLIKSVSYRAAGTLVSACVVLLLTGRWGLALAVGSIDAAAKLALFFVHERLWQRIPFGRRPIEPAVFWLTGLPGCGKSTLAERLVAELRARGLRAESIDGDSIRELLPQTGFSREAREDHIRRAALLARYLEKNGVFPSRLPVRESPARRAQELHGRRRAVRAAAPARGQARHLGAQRG